MPKMVLISSLTANSIQFKGDIVRLVEDGINISATEQKLFDFQEITNVTINEIDSFFYSQYIPDLQYPQFAFTITDLTEQQRLDLADPAISHDDTLAIIQLLTIKDSI